MKPRWLLEAVGASLLLMLKYFSPLIVPGHIAIYHLHLPLTNLIGGLLLDVLGLFVVGVALLALLGRLSSVPRRIVAACIAGFFIWHIAGTALSVLYVFYAQQSTYLSFAKSHFLLNSMINIWTLYSRRILAASVALLAVLAWLKPRVSDFAVRTVRLGLASFSFCAIWMIPQLLFSMRLGVREVPSFDHSAAQANSESSKRIVWILFDELSYNLTFDNPPTGQQFTNFQRLRSQSTSFGNIKPVGYFTQAIIPSLLAGREIDQIKSTSYGKLLYLDSERNREVPYDPNRTLFSEAQANGWNPGVAGWSIPYCRIFADVLTACFWNDSGTLPIEDRGASEDKSALANSLILPRAALALVLPNWNGNQVDLTQNKALEGRILAYRGIMTQAQKLIQNGQIRFIFIHLPVPHPPGIYSRSTHELTEGGDYLDNLALADDTLGELMQEIDGTPSASQTTMIISSDHSWRVPLWRSDQDWTREEEQISQGKFDTRPVFMVHFPGQKSGNEVLTPASELIEHGILESMLKGQIESPGDLDAFLLSSARLH